VALPDCRRGGRDEHERAKRASQNARRAAGAHLDPADRACAIAVAPEDLQIISDISDGSPGRAQELAQAGGLELYRELMGLVEPLPRIDTERLHAASDKFGGASGEASYRTFLEILKWWLLRHIREGATSRGQGTLEPWLKAWEKIDELASRADSVNLDRKQVVLNTFFELSAAARG